MSDLIVIAKEEIKRGRFVSIDLKSMQAREATVKDCHQVSNLYLRDDYTQFHEGDGVKVYSTKTVWEYVPVKKVILGFNFSFTTKTYSLQSEWYGTILRKSDTESCWVVDCGDGVRYTFHEKQMEKRI